MATRWWVIVGASVVLLVLASVALAGGDWFLECRDPSGNRLGGIDCFQYGSMPKTHSAPAAWLGFPGWAAVWLVGLAALALAVGRRYRTAHAA